jgi:COMPASS component SWD3
VNEKYSIGGAFGVCEGRAFIVSGSEDGNLVFWDVKSKEVLKTAKAHKDVVLGVDTHPFDETIVSCSLDGTIVIWRNEDEEAETATTNGKSEHTPNIKVEPDIVDVEMKDDTPAE